MFRVGCVFFKINYLSSLYLYHRTLIPTNIHVIAHKVNLNWVASLDFLQNSYNFAYLQLSWFKN